MKKLLPVLLICFWFSKISIAQISGSNTVCASYIYTYSFTAPGAASYTWSLPVGWLILSGQGTSQISVFCNTNADSVCVNAYDASSNLLAHDCLSISWGGGIGWSVQITNPGPCLCDPVGILPVPNSSGCPGSCGGGSQSPNTFFAIYSDYWLTGYYVGPADGTAQVNPPNIGSYDYYYVYLIDTTLGLNNAVRITGGTCTTTQINYVMINGCSTLILGAIANPDTACVGDTVTFTSTNNYPGATGAIWFPDSNLTLLPPGPNSFTIQAVITHYSSLPIQILMTQMAGNCYYHGHGYVISENCNSSTLISSFSSNDTSICPFACANFTNHTQNGVSYQWLFPGANTSSDTSANPQNICYTNAGDYDVTLISTNQNDTDTLVMNNYITVYQVSSAPIVNNGDTLFAGTHYMSYQWFQDTTLIPGATNNYFVPAFNGNYAVKVMDSNGCEATAFIQGVMVSASGPNSERNNFSAYYTSNNLNLVFNSAMSSIGTLEITNVSGAILYTEGFAHADKEKNIRIPMNLANGIYLVRVNTSQGNYVGKIIVNE